ncbi:MULTISPECIES: tyrosine-type recombinase/integrase [Nonomuraea]|uniref:Tyrosine-type recombinase/integrase n=1 Tax=Nonomuraea harbinensis TaxID=1286938 RepID=A0ABW1BLI3_9ACTN|nr:MULTISPECIES: tyrosine-type recombinase/integrase [Nonomuraea]
MATPGRASTTRCSRRPGAAHLPTTVTGLPRKLIEVRNKTATDPLPVIRLHDLRHVHATLLLLARVPVHVVAARLGHADPAITLRVYAHVIRSAETAAADIFAQSLHFEQG